MNASQELIPSPCIRNCCLNETDVCMGCYRTLDEITGWHSASDEARQEILSSAERRRRQAGV